MAAGGADEERAVEVGEVGFALRAFGQIAHGVPPKRKTGSCGGDVRRREGSLLDEEGPSGVPVRRLLAMIRLGLEESAIDWLGHDDGSDHGVVPA